MYIYDIYPRNHKKKMISKLKLNFQAHYGNITEY